MKTPPLSAFNVDGDDVFAVAELATSSLWRLFGDSAPCFYCVHTAAHVTAICRGLNCVPSILFIMESADNDGAKINLVHAPQADNYVGNNWSVWKYKRPSEHQICPGVLLSVVCTTKASAKHFTLGVINTLYSYQPGNSRNSKTGKYNGFCGLTPNGCNILFLGGTGKNINVLRVVIIVYDKIDELLDGLPKLR